MPLRKKYFLTFFSDGEVPTAITLEGVGIKGLNGTAIKKRTFFVASLRKPYKRQGAIEKKIGGRKRCEKGGKLN